MPAAFALAQRAIHDTAVRHGWLTDGPRAPDEAEVRGRWLRQRPLVEFIAAQAGTGIWVCEEGDELVGFVQVARFGGVDVLTDLMVAPSHHRRGVGRDLLARLWPAAPTPEHGRVVVAAGAPADLTLYTGFGAMPVAGHWLLRQRADSYLERRTRETVDGAEAAVHALEASRAVEAWKHLEPGALGHDRPFLHEFFGRTRRCLATVDDRTGRPTALCWVSSDGEIGPAVGEGPQELVSVVLGCLDRVAKMQEPDVLGVYCTSASRALLRRLRRLGFRVVWPGWLLASGPLPALDRYMPTTPPRLL